MQTTQDVIIVGGGISGTSAAYELAKRGLRVTLVERGELHSMASGWTLAGVRQSGRHPAELPLARAAIRRWETLSEELGSDVEYRQDGNLRLALSDEQIPVIKQVVADGNAAGIPMEYIDGTDAVQTIAPALTDQVVGASLCPSDGHANNLLTVEAYANATKRHGAQILTGTEVTALLVVGQRITGVQTATGSLNADTVILATGIYTPQLLAPLGLDLPLKIIICPVFTTEPTRPLLRQVLGMADGGFAGRQEVSGRLRLIGRSVPWDGERHTVSNTMPTMAKTAEMITGAVRILPEVANLHLDEIWGGLIDSTPDAIPVIDRVPEFEGLIVAAGFSGHGFGIGPATGEILADLASTGTAGHDISAFKLGRFTAGVEQETLLLHG